MQCCLCSGLWWPSEQSLSPLPGSNRHLRNWSHLEFFTNTWPFLLSVSLFMLILQLKVFFQLSCSSKLGAPTLCSHNTWCTASITPKDCLIVKSYLFGFWNWVSLYTCDSCPWASQVWALQVCTTMSVWLLCSFAPRMWAISEKIPNILAVCVLTVPGPQAGLKTMQVKSGATRRRVQTSVCIRSGATGQKAQTPVCFRAGATGQKAQTPVQVGQVWSYGEEEGKKREWKVWKERRHTGKKKQDFSHSISVLEIVLNSVPLTR